MNFTNHHSKDKHKHEHDHEHEHEHEHVKFKSTCCCHDYPGHFSSVDCNDTKLNSCKFMLGYDRTKYNPNMLYTHAHNGYNNHHNDADNKHHNDADNKHHNDNNHHNHIKKSCNCK